MTDKRQYLSPNFNCYFVDISTLLWIGDWITRNSKCQPSDKLDLKLDTPISSIKKMLIWKTPSLTVPLSSFKQIILEIKHQNLQFVCIFKALDNFNGINLFIKFEISSDVKKTLQDFFFLVLFFTIFVTVHIFLKSFFH